MMIALRSGRTASFGTSMSIMSASFSPLLLLLLQPLLNNFCSATHLLKGTACPQPLGLTTGALEDWQLSSSSELSGEADCATKFARLNEPGARAWCAARRSKKEWLLVDLGVESLVSGVAVQGRVDEDEWVTNFMVSYSNDAYKWDFARDIYGNKKIFKGNSDAYTVRHSYLEHPVSARFVKVHVAGWHKHPSMRLEVIGCQDCNEIISMQPFTEVSSSSHKRWSRRRGDRRSVRSCLPEMADIYSAKGWCPKRQNDNQWLQFDLGPPTTVTGVITRGQGDNRRRFVTAYTLSYSNDSSLWFFYKESNHLEAKVFAANLDSTTERRHYLNEPLTARFVRIHPVAWHRRIGMRAAVLGCPRRRGQSCGEGFMRVNDGAACVANKAFKGETWVNDGRGRAAAAQWRFGHSSLAVDGNMDTQLANCAILDNYRGASEAPLWRVDLGKTQRVRGVLILTWQGKGQDKLTTYSDYVHNLETLVVYVSTEALESTSALRAAGAGAKCASVSRRSNALFHPAVHFECPEPLHGQYVYVKAVGAPDRWSKTFNVVLCEVMVY